MIDVLYFAWVRERIGLPRERVTTGAATVAGLVAEGADAETHGHSGHRPVSEIIELVTGADLPFQQGHYWWKVILNEGKDTLVVYDDLSKQANAYRQMSLLLRRPPGREAYPGDIFFIHSRLLERAGKRDDKFKGGSITALPIIETQAGRLSDYIPTNLISITDGQIYLERELFNKGFLPAIDIGRSVSRIGSKAQPPALKKMAAKLKLDYSQFLEVEVFTKFGAKVEPQTQKLIDRGRALRVALKQKRFEHIAMPEEVIIFFLSNEGYLQQLPLTEIDAFIEKFIRHIKKEAPEILNAIEVTKEIDEALIERLRATADDFSKAWHR